MRYRALDSNGDYRFGERAPFLIDSPEAVAQAISTRLQLKVGEWFLDAEEGTDYIGSVLGYGTTTTRDLEIKARILGTPGVRELIEYASSVSPSREFSATARVDTIYGETTITI